MRNIFFKMLQSHQHLLHLLLLLLGLLNQHQQEQEQQQHLEHKETDLINQLQDQIPVAITQ